MKYLREVFLFAIYCTLFFLPAAGQSKDAMLTAVRAGQNIYFRIPASTLGKDIMVSSRLKSNSGIYLGYLGDQLNINMIRFEKDKDSIYIVGMMDGRNINPPGLYTQYRQVSKRGFLIKSNIPECPGCELVDVGDYLRDENKELLVLNAPGVIGGFVKDESSINDIKSFAEHVEINSVQVYQDVKGKRTFADLSTTLFFLPEKPMKPRYVDKRVGIWNQLIPDSAGKEMINVITKWRLEPKAADLEKYLKGTLVEPEKPIIYYLDPTIPKEWLPYFIQGIEAWQPVFEKAGFKRAIMAKPAPTAAEDPEWSISSSRYNAILYQDNEEENGSWSAVIDPRSGEIVSSHVRMYKGLLAWLERFYIIQASPVDPRARTMNLNHEILGKLLKMIITHEIGHSLGMDHNYHASTVMPVEKYRDEGWLKENGLSTSIMDYARFNYIAQPGDKIKNERALMNSIGVYDEWAIDWTYRYYNMPLAEEKKMLEQLVGSKIKDDRFKWGITDFMGDPDVDVEALSDNDIKASEYGIRNLQFVMKHLPEWAKGTDREKVKKYYWELCRHLGFYLHNVASNIGGFYHTQDATGNLKQEMVPQDLQWRALQFANEQLIKPPLWLLYAENNPGPDIDIPELLKDQQINILGLMLANDRLRAMVFGNKDRVANVSYLTEVLSSIRHTIFADLYNQNSVAAHNRPLQDNYVRLLYEFFNAQPQQGMMPFANPPLIQSEFQVISEILRNDLKQLQVDIADNSKNIKDSNSIYYLNTLEARIRKELNKVQNEPQNTSSMPASVFDPAESFNPVFYPSSNASETRSSAGKPGPKYWQNSVDYSIAASLDTSLQEVKGAATISYTNNSPDDLDYLWIQLDQNFRRKDSRNGVMRFGSDPPIETNYSAGIQIEKLIINIGGVGYSPAYIIDDTRMQVRLKNALKGGGGKVSLAISYRFNIPDTEPIRMGRLQTPGGSIYQVAQWFPRMSVYDDINGWNTSPYIQGSEFYLEYGDIDYSITVPGNMIVTGSGELTNAGQVLNSQQLSQLSKARNSDSTILISQPRDVAENVHAKTWKFKCLSTRDVAWSASAAFIWDAARINLPGRKTALAMSFYYEGQRKFWNTSTQFIKYSIEYNSKKWYPYPYQNAVNVAGNVLGMEYPGIIFCSVNGLGLIAHEFGHNWFPMIVGSNERVHAWMDEGLTTFLEQMVIEEHSREYKEPIDDRNSIFWNNPSLMYQGNALMNLPLLSTGSYVKTGVGMFLLRNHILGPDRFDYAFQQYIRHWAFKHPSPWDFFHAIENGAGEDLSWFWRGWFFTNWKLDLGVLEVNNVDPADPGKGAKVVIRNYEKLPMPFSVEVTEENGKVHQLNFPVEVWMKGKDWIFWIPATSTIKEVVIDPKRELPDVNYENNAWKRLE